MVSRLNLFPAGETHPQEADPLRFDCSISWSTYANMSDVHDGAVNGGVNVKILSESVTSHSFSSPVSTRIACPQIR